ncbi:MAG TPA: RES family NAD+ phosphorylase [Bryobacteraceae bacterium]|nr:RES family NAD+ phosphorylase [Bryobacteraceae bacterium]
MVLWRISRHRDLSGIGGLRANGRWHHAGQPIIYLSENPASALLEVCVHTASNDVPPEFTLLRIEGPEIVAPSVLADSLPKGWQSRTEVTRDIGTRWLRGNDSVLLKVLSAIVPETVNFLFNPLHPNAKRFRSTEALACPFDTRLKGI